MGVLQYSTDTQSEGANLDHITGADVLQYGALGLCFVMILASVSVLRYAIRLLSGSLGKLGQGLLDFSNSNQVLASKLDGIGSSIHQRDESIVETHERLIEHDERAKQIHQTVLEIDKKVDRLHCVRAKIDGAAEDHPPTNEGRSTLG